jgi:hypothetical protein
MATKMQSLRQQLDSLLDTLDESQLQQALQYVCSLQGTSMGDPRALIEWANSLSPEEREASKEVARILEEEHARELRALESAE